MLTVELERTGLRGGAAVLDIGCGGGRHAYACAKAGAVVIALDRSTDELTTVAETVAAMAIEGEIDRADRVTALAGDATSLPFLDGSFDLAIASEVFEHLIDDRAAVREVARVLRRGALLAVSVPRFWPERVNWLLSAAYHSAEGGHIRIYRRSQLIALLESEGLRFVSSHHAHALHSPYWWLKCVVGVDDDSNRLVRAFHRFLVYDIVRRPRWLRVADRALNPLIGKSLVCYLERL